MVLRKKKSVAPVEEDSTSEQSDNDLEVQRHYGGYSQPMGEGDEDSVEDSGRGLLAAVTTRLVPRKGHDEEEDDEEEQEDGEGEGGDGEDDDDAARQTIKPMMSTVKDVVDEGLGDDFEETPWVPPTVKRAEEHRSQTIYRAGKSSIWDTRLHELEDMGIGVSLYFQFLKFLTGTYFVLTLLSLPSLLFAISGSGFTEEIFGTTFTSLDISYYITAFECLSSVFFILAIVYWRLTTDRAVERVADGKITATDYSVYVEGLPKTARSRDIGTFFSDLYQLKEVDWKGRPPYEFAQPVFSVENTQDKWYKGKWVAEVCAAREVGRGVKAYKGKKDTVLQLRRKRAEAKMYNDGTPFLDGNGADPKKFEKAVKAADKLGEAIAKTTDKIMEMRKDINGKQACVGGFIVFNHPLSLHRCMEDFSSLSVFKKYPKELKFEGIHKLKVVKAPEPDNIIWENLEFSKTKRYFRQNVTGLVSFALLLIAFALVLGASGIQQTYAEIVPKITYCQSEVPALYFGDYARSLAVVDDLSLVRPDQSYRDTKDLGCQAALGDDAAVYMVYTLEEGDDSYLSPILNYTLDACESGSGICPEAGDSFHCPCATGDSLQMCDTLECDDPGGDPGGTCGEFVFSTVSGCYCYERLRDEQEKTNIFSAMNDLRVQDADICGAFTISWVLAKVFNFAISFMTPFINSLLQTFLTGLVAWEHNTSDDETATRLMYGVFQTQFINTGLLFLLVYGTAPLGYTTPALLQDFKIFTGAYNDFSREWQKDAGHALLVSFILAAIGPHVLPLINCFVLSKRRIRKATEKVEDQDGTYVMQGDLNEVFVGPVFDFTTRYSYLLTLLFVAMAYSGGLFGMNALSFLFFLITYWVDKAMLLRFYRRPPHREDALQRQVNKALPWALLLHLGFTCWFLGTESLKSEVITESLSQATSYEDVLAAYEAKFGILATRLLRTNVFPVLLLTLGVLVWCALEFIGKFFPLLAVLGAGVRFVVNKITGTERKRVTAMQPGKKFKSRWTSEVAAYTDVYFQYISKNGELTTAEKLEGWMVSHLADKSVVKKKGWDMDEEDVPPGRGDAKFSWEVIRDNSIFTYRIDLVPAYAEVMAALQEEERLYKEDMSTDSDDSSAGSGTGTGGGGDGDDDDDDNEDEEEAGESETEHHAPTRAAPTSKTSKAPKTTRQKKNAANPFNDFEEGAAGGEDSFNPFSDFMDGVSHDTRTHTIGV
eukprot:jgi/Undpi1/13173/HiC_scaffold_8.g02835.m1